MTRTEEGDTSRVSSNESTHSEIEVSLQPEPNDTATVERIEGLLKSIIGELMEVDRRVDEGAQAGVRALSAIEQRLESIEKRVQSLVDEIATASFDERWEGLADYFAQLLDHSKRHGRVAGAVTDGFESNAQPQSEDGGPDRPQKGRHERYSL